MMTPSVLSRYSQISYEHFGYSEGRSSCGPGSEFVYLPVAIGLSRHYLCDERSDQPENDVVEWNKNPGLFFFFKSLSCISQGTVLHLKGSRPDADIILALLQHLEALQLWNGGWGRGRALNPS